MKTVQFPTMDAVNYARMQAINSNMSYFPGQMSGYQNTKIDIPLPSECPCCGRSLADNLIPIIAVNNADKGEDESELAKECDVLSVYRCTSCDKLFGIWSHHIVQNDDIDDPEYDCCITVEYPFKTNTTEFSPDIQNLSPQFTEIYNQSEIAENQGLIQICGMGYRRSLEFLINDYLKAKQLDDDISDNTPLSKKIDKIGDPKIKMLAIKTAWLGNDCTHIENKHPKRDLIPDMKKFIMTIVKFIDYDFAYEDAKTIEKR